MTLKLDESPLSLGSVQQAAFQGTRQVALGDSVHARVRRSHERLLELLEKRIPIYGVTTGFGDSCHRYITPSRSEELQRNLVSYLSCGTGAPLPREASRAILLIRLKSLSRGFSGVSIELIERMKTHLENDWIPVVPREGSLGASGDLIPLAYLARAIQGEGEIHGKDGPITAAQALTSAGLSPYRLKPKEGLALVNGTSAMAGLAAVNLAYASRLAQLSTIASAWLCLAIRGRTEAFGELVNEKANIHTGQARAAREIRALLEEEGYRPLRGQDVKVQDSRTDGFVQDRYSLRCSPQILGPVLETLGMVSTWVEREINGTSDNPLIGDDGSLEMGGNFYGGYLSQGMDYVKISLAQVADLADRQLMLLFDERSNRGLPPNLADWPSLPEEERFLHHGLKGLHQAVSAITSEIMPRAHPSSIHSRSSESHNQDKVSLGMSSAVRCHEQIDPMFTVLSMQLACLAQALDLRGTKLQGQASRALYEKIRTHVPFVSRDIALDGAIRALSSALKENPHEAT